MLRGAIKLFSKGIFNQSIRSSSSIRRARRNSPSPLEKLQLLESAKHDTIVVKSYMVLRELRYYRSTTLPTLAFLRANS